MLSESESDSENQYEEEEEEEEIENNLVFDDEGNLSPLNTVSTFRLGSAITGRLEDSIVVSWDSEAAVTEVASVFFTNAERNGNFSNPVNVDLTLGQRIPQ